MFKDPNDCEGKLWIIDSPNHHKQYSEQKSFWRGPGLDRLVAPQAGFMYFSMEHASGSELVCTETLRNNLWLRWFYWVEAKPKLLLSEDTVAEISEIALDWNLSD